MSRKQTFTDYEIIQDVNNIEDQINFSRRIKFLRGIKKLKKGRFGFSKFKKAIPAIHDIYDRWANISFS